MKSIDFLKRVLTEAKVKPEVLALITDNLPDELPEEAVTSYEQNLFTLDRAQADPELTRTMQARAFKALNDGWDKDFNSFAEQLDADTAAKIKAEKFTRKKWETIAEALKKGSGASDDEKQKTSRKEIEALHAQLREKESMLETVKKEADGRVMDFKKDYLLSEKLGTIEFADPFKPLKHMLKEDFMRKLSQKSIILAVENDQLVPRRKSETGELMDVFEANTKVGLDDLIKKELQDFIKKSAGGGGQQQQQQQQNYKTDAPKQGLTLDEINKLRVAENFKKLKT